MLISQRIAKDPKFITTHGDPRSFQGSNAEIRMAVINSTKFLIDNYGITDDDHTSVTFGELEERIFGAAGAAAKHKRDCIYQKYARPCYQAMSLESDQMLILVWLTSEDPVTWQMAYINRRGIMTTHLAQVSLEPGREVPRRQYRALNERVHQGYQRVIDGPDPELSKKATSAVLSVVNILRGISWIACETLTLINCSNVVRHTVRPTSKETAGLPKVLLPRYEYHVLDVFREHDQITSLADAAEKLWAPREGKKGRMHLVRGHFKKTRHGLYWWNPFVRNRKNLTTLGVVDKDYLAITPAPPPP